MQYYTHNLSPSNDSEILLYPPPTRPQIFPSLLSLSPNPTTRLSVCSHQTTLNQERKVRGKKDRDLKAFFTRQKSQNDNLFPLPGRYWPAGIHPHGWLSQPPRLYRRRNRQDSIDRWDDSWLNIYVGNVLLLTILRIVSSEGFDRGRCYLKQGEDDQRQL